MKTLGRKKSVNSVEEAAVEAGVKDAGAGAGAGAEAVGLVGEDMIALAVIRLMIVIGRSITMAEQDVVALVVDAEGVDTMTVVTATIAVTVAGVDLAGAIPTATNNLSNHRGSDDYSNERRDFNNNHYGSGTRDQQQWNNRQSSNDRHNQPYSRQY